MTDKISLKVTCPYCGRKQRVERKVTFTDYIDDWDRILTDFDVEKFHCECGETFLGAETIQSEKIGTILDVVKDLKSEGKLDITEDSVKIKLGFSDIWKLIREVKDLEGDL